jgi:flagellar hook-basal body complex protein FliE
MSIESIGAGATAGIGALADPHGRPGAGAATGTGGAGTAFTDSLGRLLESANTSDGAANSAVGRMLDGSGDVHEAMIALQQADMMLQLTVQVRNKLVQAYQDIMRMPV